MPDKSIAVVARGRYPGMREAVSTLFLRFDVRREGEHYKLEMREKIERAFPTIFPRQLDHMQRVASKLILVQDTADQDDFQIMCVDMLAMRRDGNNQVHKVLNVKNLKESGSAN